MENRLISFKDIINSILIDLGLSQSKLADKLGIDQSTISKWVTGAQEPSFRMLQTICIKLGLDPAEILGLKEF